jgi:AhpD family alkylhydroperoxidase
MTTQSTPTLNPTRSPGAVRLDVDALAPRTSRAMASLDAASRQTSIEPGLLELVRLRASQINGCAYCVDQHSRDAVAGGETTRRLFALTVWREVPFFTDRERAALALTERVTRVADCEVSDADFDAAAQHFDPTQLAELIWVIAVINTWNRLGVTAHPWPLS